MYVSNSFANSGGSGKHPAIHRDVNSKTLSDSDIATPEVMPVDKRNNVWVFIQRSWKHRQGLGGVAMSESDSVLVIDVPVYCRTFPGPPLFAKEFETYTWPFVSNATLSGPASPGSVNTVFAAPQSGPYSVTIFGIAPWSGTHRFPD